MKESRRAFLTTTRRWCFRATLCAVLLAGVRTGYSGRSDHADQAAALVVALGLLVHCAIDARLNEIHVPGIAYLLGFMLWPVAVPLYWIAQYGWRGLSWSVATGALLYGLYALSFLAACLSLRGAVPSWPGN